MVRLDGESATNWHRTDSASEVGKGEWVVQQEHQERSGYRSETSSAT